MRKMKDSGVEWIGEMPEGWECVQLSRICTDIQTGPFGSQLHSSDYIENGIPVINPVNIIDYNIYPDYRCSISTELASSLHRHILNEDEIIFARRGEMGRCALITKESDGFFCGTGCFKIQFKKIIIAKFILYYLRSRAISAFLIINSSGTTLDNLNCVIISSLPCIVPPIKIQQDIISYLDRKTSQIDNAISLIDQSIEKLKAYKQSVITQAVTKGLDPGAKMKDSGVEWIGKIPEGWGIGKIGNYLFNYDIKQIYNGEFYIGLENIESFNFKILKTDFIPIGQTNYFKKGNILFGKLRPYLAKCTIAPEDGMCSTEILVLDSFNNNVNHYFKYLLISNPIIYILSSFSYGTKMPRTNWQQIQNISIPIPCKIEEQTQIASYLDRKTSQIDSLISEKQRLREKLTDYKKSLIYECVTGKREI